MLAHLTSSIGTYIYYSTHPEGRRDKQGIITTDQVGRKLHKYFRRLNITEEKLSTFS